MSYVAYEIESTRIIRTRRGDKCFATKGAATAAIKRAGFTAETHAVAEFAEFHSKIEKQETKRNLRSGTMFTQPVNTPSCCDPSTETYWSM